MFRKTVWAALFGTCLLSPHAMAEELRFDRLFVIGDSLSDAGTYTQAAIAGGLRRAAPIASRPMRSTARP